MLLRPFYDPKKSYEENFKNGPFGLFANNEVLEEKGEPSFNFFGYKVFSPFGIAAGPLINGKFVQSALDKGFNIVTYKTVRSEQYSSHPWPNVLSVNIPDNFSAKNNFRLTASDNFKEPLSITNSFGVPSPDPSFWSKDMAQVLKNIRPGQILVGAFQGTKLSGQSIEEYVNDFCKTASILKKIGIKVLEVNLSCPNEGTKNLLCYDVQNSLQVIKAIKKEIGEIPLIIKISYFRDEELMKNFIKEVGSLVQGISAINTISAEIVDENDKQILPGEGRLSSGICGHAIKQAGLETVTKLKKMREEFGYSYTIIGVGGVMNADDFFEYRNAGADIVMSATGAMWNPYLAREIKERLV